MCTLDVSQESQVQQLSCILKVEYYENLPVLPCFVHSLFVAADFIPFL